MRKCWHTDELAFPIKLDQQGVDRFTVTYGRQIKTGLTYNDAARELGAAIMHALACDDRLNNAERKRRLSPPSFWATRQQTPRRS